MARAIHTHPHRLLMAIAADCVRRLERLRVVAWMLVTIASAAPAAAQVMEIDAAGNAQWIGGDWEPAVESGASPVKPAPGRYRAALAAAATEYGLSEALLQALAASESGFDPAAVSPAGAIGLMQLMPQTARELGVDPRDPVQNIRGGAAYLRRQLDRFNGDLERALAAYNAGPERVERHGGIPPLRETRAYVAANLDRLASVSLATVPPPAAMDLSGATP